MYWDAVAEAGLGIGVEMDAASRSGTTLAWASVTRVRALSVSVLFDALATIVVSFLSTIVLS